MKKTYHKKMWKLYRFIIIYYIFLSFICTVIDLIILKDSIVQWIISWRRKQCRSEPRNKTRMGQRRINSMPSKHLGRDAFLADAMDFRTCWNLSFNYYYFNCAGYYTNHHFFTICNQYKWESKRRYYFT